MPARLLLLFFVLCSPLPALADAIRVSLEGRAALGEALPTLLVHIEEPIAGFEVKLKRSDGKTVELKGGGKPGITRRIELEQPEGRFHYEGELVVRFPDAESGSMPLSFDTELYGALKLEVRKEDVDVAGRKLRFTLNRPARRAELTVLMDTGKKAFEGEVPFNGEQAGTPLELTWPAAEGRVMKISVRAFDTSEFYTGVDLFPWQVDIPHEEVNFASGSADVPAGERGKLDKSHALIAEALAKYGRFAALRLYVLGHTDTVGKTADNRELSLKRARSLAAYFRKRGLKVPVFYEGFGEESPAVATPDETAEAGNRRAEYIIAVEDPVLQHAPFPPRWRKL
ncbi:OmpA family protein [Pyxidicoccus fallax]|uniref:OmpA family protein n=1 Tax=Pyxidicoccus fallax TaxID=394095 RepID=A0A848LP16_9BACT|nr:OmpA family protein [Pyxidicoccus fallax]NMO19343.1 OmpA family protein [Pyxidicoccus fallax]NPC79095.1 OmpA family protein [Pyxidicoccus fallax]